MLFLVGGTITLIILATSARGFKKPMLFFMLPPFLVLSLYPLLARLMALLSAPGGAMGGW